MNSNQVLFYCVMAILSSLMLVSTTSNRLSSTFEAYATNNCDSTSLCEEFDNSGLSTQNNNCRDNSICGNLALGPSPDTQNNNCNRSSCTNLAIGGSTQDSNCVDASCTNFAFGFSNNQIINCRATACFNNGDGSSSTQNIACANGGGCTNQDGGFSGPVTQNTACQSSTCVNIGTDTNVYSNSASESCFSNGPDTTTICQGDRTPLVIPNH